jgi:hypothetical protein
MARRAQEVRGWREQVNERVARDAGFAYQAYVRLKLASVRAFGAQLIIKLRGAPERSPLSRVMSEIIDAWAVRKGVVYESDETRALEFETPGAGEMPVWVRYLLAFDVKYRERRLHFDRRTEQALSAIDQAQFKGSTRWWSTVSRRVLCAADDSSAKSGPTISVRCLRLVHDIIRSSPRPTRPAICTTMPRHSWSVTSTSSIA